MHKLDNGDTFSSLYLYLRRGCGFLRILLLYLRFALTIACDSGPAMMYDRFATTSNIQEDRLDSPETSTAAFPKRVYADAEA